MTDALTTDTMLQTLASVVQAGEASRRLHGIAAVREIVPPGHYRRRRPAYLDTTDLLPHEAIFKLYTDSLYQSFGALSHFVLRDATVTDQGAVITRGDALLEESCWEFLVHGNVPFGLAREDEQRFRRVERPAALVAPPSLLLKRPWWRNYGHWMIDAAALLAFLMRSGVGGFEQIVIGATPNQALRAVFRDTLARIAPGMPVMEHEDGAMLQFAELHYVQPVRRPPLFTLPDAVAALAQAMHGDDGNRASGGRRLFVSRQRYGRRKLENEAEAIAVCARYGFETVYPEELSLREQVALFGAASAIAGVKGAGLTNLVFAPPDAAVIVLSPGDFSDPFFWDIAAARGMAYGEMFGPLFTSDAPVGHNPFTIDPGRLDGMLAAMLGVARSAPAPAPAAVPAPGPVAVAAVPVPPSVFPPPLAGEFYLSCLARIHAALQPRTYFEIGTLNGLTLALSRCRSIAVDPAFRITEPMPGMMPSLFMFQGGSDRFFAEVDPQAVLGGPIDLAFLDGMHLFEYLLRDFINTERHCHRGSTILLHDCIPLDAVMAERDPAAVPARTDGRFPGWWTGDVWKTADALLRWRPDLEIIALDAPPTGLIAIRNLDPGSRVLEREYATIVEAYRAGEDGGGPGLAAYFGRLAIRPTAMVETFAPIQPAG